MFTRMKYLGLALLAFAAFGCASAGTASAKIVHDFVSSAEGPVIITGEGLPELPIKYEFGSGSTMTCLTNKANGTIKAMPTTELTVEFTHSNCVLNEMAATVESQNCRYVFSGVTDETEHGSMTLECPSGKLLVKLSGCTLEIGPQLLGQGVSYKTTQVGGAPSDLDVTLTANGGTYSKTGLLCALIGGTGNDLAITGAYTMKIFRDESGKEGVQAGLSMKSTIFP